VTAVHETVRAQTGGTSPEPLAPEPIWSHCLAAGAAGPRGTLVAAAAAAAASDGQPLRADWPFNDSLGVGTEPPPAAAGPAPWRTAALTEHVLARDGLEHVIENSLAAGRPVLLGIEVTREFRQAPRSGLVALAPLTTPLGEGHAVLVVGANTDPARGRQLLIRNTWGPGWGAGGYGWLTLSWIATFGINWASIAP
jgi:C1A family cysteine protease